MEFLSKNWLALLAFLLSLASITISFCNYRRDKAKLVTSGRFFNRGEQNGRGIHVKAVNVGRRPIILTQIQFLYDDGSLGGIVTGKHPDGLKLNEKEHWEHWFENGDSTLYKPEDDKTAVDFWFLDTQGKKHRVKASKEHLKKVWEK